MELSNFLDDEYSGIHSFPQSCTYVATYGYDYLMFGSMKLISQHVGWN